MMDQVLLARIQFGMTIGFHFLYPPVTIGLAWLLVWLEARAARDPSAEPANRLFGRIFAILYIVGIASGIVMTLQFGTNWSRFAVFVNDIFGPLLVAEVLIAFFVESIFFGIWLFGRGRVSEGLRRASILLVAIGAVVSAFWITAADSWMQTPAGYALSSDGSRALLTDFGAALFSPSALPRFAHVMMSAMTITGLFVAGVSAWLVLRGRGGAFVRRVLAVGVCVGLLGSALVTASGVNEMFSLGSQQVEKVSVFRGIADTAGPPVGPGAESVSAASVPEDEAPLPPATVTKNCFWLMAGLAVAMLAISLVAFLALVFRVLPKARVLLWILVAAIPLPIVATESGWIAAEVGRQPWIVYKLLKTSDAVSVSVQPGMLVFSLVLIGLVYVLFLGISVGMTVHELRKTPLDGEIVSEGRAS